MVWRCDIRKMDPPIVQDAVSDKMETQDIEKAL